MLQFIVDHWKDIALAILAIDAALIPIFPQAGILVEIKNFLTSFVPKQT